MIVNTLIIYDENISVSIDILISYNVAVNKNDFNRNIVSKQPITNSIIQYITYHNTNVFQTCDKELYYIINFNLYNKLII